MMPKDKQQNSKDFTTQKEILEET